MDGMQSDSVGRIKIRPCHLILNTCRTTSKMKGNSLAGTLNKPYIERVASVVWLASITVEECRNIISCRSRTAFRYE